MSCHDSYCHDVIITENHGPLLYSWDFSWRVSRLRNGGHLLPGLMVDPESQRHVVKKWLVQFFDYSSFSRGLSDLVACSVTFGESIIKKVFTSSINTRRHVQVIFIYTSLRWHSEIYLSRLLFTKPMWTTLYSHSVIIKNSENPSIPKEN